MARLSSAQFSHSLFVCRKIERVNLESGINASCLNFHLLVRLLIFFSSLFYIPREYKLRTNNDCARGRECIFGDRIFDMELEIKIVISYIYINGRLYSLNTHGKYFRVFDYTFASRAALFTSFFIIAIEIQLSYTTSPINRQTKLNARVAGNFPARPCVATQILSLLRA